MLVMLLKSIKDLEARSLIDSGSDFLLFVHTGEEKEIEIWEHLCTAQALLPACYELLSKNILTPEESSLFFVRYPRLLICSHGNVDDIIGLGRIWSWLAARR
jgi:hypothetical protein